MGFSSMYFTSSKRFDRASLVEGFKQIKDRGVRYEDMFPGSYDPAERVKEIDRGRDRRRGDLQRRRHGVERHQALQARQGALAVLPGLQRLDRRVPGVAPERFICNGTLPTTGLDDASPSCERCVDLGLRTVQLESYPSGSFEIRRPRTTGSGRRPSSSTCRSTCTRSSSSRPVTSARRSPRRACRQGDRAKKLGLDVEAGKFPVILWRMISSGVFERFPDLKFVGTEVHTGWVPYYLERFDESVKRNRRDWNLPLLPSEYFRRNVIGRLHRRRDRRRQPLRHRRAATSCGVPTSRTRRAAGRSTTSSVCEILERAGATPSEIERIMWRNAADLYKLPYDERAEVQSAA